MPLHRTCSQSFREKLLKEFPGLENNPCYWQHLNRLLYCSVQLVYHNFQSHRVMAVPISQKHVAFDFRAVPDLLNNRFIAIDYINLFRKEVYHYEIIDWNYKEHQCRYAVCDFPTYILQLVEDERDGLYSKDKRVLIETGKTFTPKVRTMLRKQDQALAKLITKHYNMPQVAVDIQLYLNSLSPQRFSRVLTHLPEARSALYDTNATGNLLMDSQTQKTQRDILTAIEEQPQPFYIPSSQNKTVRLFEINKGLQGIHSHLRKILTQDCVEVDIQNAHLAIVAMLWDIQEVQDFLSTGKSVWEELLPAMGYQYPNPTLKPHLKDFFYGLIYGMGNDNRERGMTAIFGPEAYQSFMNHPIVQVVLKGRKKRFKEIEEMKVFTTPFGKQEKPYSYTDKEGNYQSNIPSLASQEANDIEMLLLAPIFERALDTDELHIILYQYDGLTLDIKRKNRQESYLKSLKKAVERRAKELGVITTLTY